ncbi:methyltransferase-like protein 13 isoform X1 [Iris pallida]|uniref:EEF1A lysine methyltransferase 4 n=1 Tax=Iris pallida TaxID=29817 RepID=A0AAX6GFB4_IRIPA|nr:methyltransferase-like protein 13 isoform X1 [Iris pallida]
MDPGESLSDPAPKSASAYKDPGYWDGRFSAEEHYEWLKDYSHFRHLVRRHLRPSHSVLEVGCGNSRLCEELFGDGFADLTCTDLSPVAVDRKRRRLLDRGLADIRVMEADMLDLPFADECFDVVIEKGTMDVLFVDSGDPWNPHSATVSKVMKMLEGIHRVLKPGGMFVSISFGQPHFRRPLFEAPYFTWSFEYDTFGDGFHYFFYTLKKGSRTLESNGCISKKCSIPSISMLHEEMESEDYLLRTCIDEL